MLQRSKFIFLFYIASLLGMNGRAQVYYAGTQPGKAVCKRENKRLVLSNAVLAFSLQYEKNKITGCDFTDLVTGKKITENASAYFQVFMKNKAVVSSADCTIEKIIAGNKDKKIALFKLVFYNKSQGLQIESVVSLSDKDNYVCQNWRIISHVEPIDKVELIQLSKTYSPHSAGTVDGSPIVINNMFFAIEHPMFKVDSSADDFHLFIKAPFELSENVHFSISSVMGVTPVGQLRRGFLYYLEKTRAAPYRPFLHYNSWFDLSYNADTLKATDCMDRVHAWIDSLTIKRKIALNAFLWDSGWDNFDQLWHFNKALPRGFSDMAAYAQQYHTAMGVWISPWGGYDDAVRLRMEGAQKYHPELEKNENGFTLAGKHYYDYFKNVAKQFLQKENVRIFKFDGVGAGLRASGPGEKYQKDIEAFLHLITDLRKLQPAAYFSLTVGSWPSPYWLRYGDNIWRGGGDMGFAGEGNRRQKWLSFRDADSYKNIVQRAPLYPLNALMNHGIAVADKGIPASLENDFGNLSDDFWAFFANGTSLQEMYVNPHKLNTEEWDELARVIHWAKAHKGILVDTHWVGGDPSKGDVYGYASWNTSGGVLMLRNPSPKQVAYSFVLDSLLEIPSVFSGSYRIVDARTGADFSQIISSENKSIVLKPFEVKVLEVYSVKK